MVQAPVIDWNAVIAEAVRVASKQQTGYKHDTPGSPTTTDFLHGPGGILSYPGVDPTMFHTIVGSMGLLGNLPTSPSVYTNPLYQTITGITDETGDEASSACDNGPTAGNLKGCIVQAPFGKYRMQTPELDITRLGQRVDRADPLDLQLVGSPIGGSFFGPQASMDVPANVLTNEMAARVLTRNVALHRKLARQLWIGNPSNNVDDGYKELTGLEILVATGYVDAITNTACPSMDSDVKNFAYADVASNGSDLVDALTYIFRTRRNLALRTGADPVRFAFVMREELFYEVTKVWPCSYYLGGCTVVDGDGQRLLITARDQTDLRDQLRAGKFLLIDGIRVEVIFDDGIPQDTNTTNASVPNPCFASDIYLLPMSVQGRATLFLEYFDFNNPSIQSAIPLLDGGIRAVGAFLETASRTRNCFQIQVEIEPRLVLRTPWLAGRLQNVVYCPLQSTRQPFPDDPYFVNGGVQGSRAGPSYYNIWGGGA